MTQVHLEEYEFELVKKILDKHVTYHALVLDCGVAGMVEFYVIDNTLYYADRFFTNEHHLQKKMNYYDKAKLHAEVYQKLAFINLIYCS